MSQLNLLISASTISKRIKFHSIRFSEIYEILDVKYFIRNGLHVLYCYCLIGISRYRGKCNVFVEFLNLNNNIIITFPLSMM